MSQLVMAIERDVTVLDLQNFERRKHVVKEVSVHERGSTTFSKISKEHGPICLDAVIVVKTVANMPDSIYTAPDSSPYHTAMHLIDVY